MLTQLIQQSSEKKMIRGRELPFAQFAGWAEARPGGNGGRRSKQDGDGKLLRQWRPGAVPP